MWRCCCPLLDEMNLVLEKSILIKERKKKNFLSFTGLTVPIYYNKCLSIKISVLSNKNMMVFMVGLRRPSWLPHPSCGYGFRVTPGNHVHERPSLGLSWSGQGEHLLNLEIWNGEWGGATRKDWEWFHFPQDGWTCNV